MVSLNGCPTRLLGKLLGQQGKSSQKWPNGLEVISKRFTSDIFKLLFLDKSSFEEQIFCNIFLHLHFCNVARLTLPY